MKSQTDQKWDYRKVGQLPPVGSKAELQKCLVEEFKNRDIDNGNIQESSEEMPIYIREEVEEVSKTINKDFMKLTYQPMNRQQKNYLKF